MCTYACAYMCTYACAILHIGGGRPRRLAGCMAQSSAVCSVHPTAAAACSWPQLLLDLRTAQAVASKTCMWFRASSGGPLVPWHVGHAAMSGMVPDGVYERRRGPGPKLKACGWTAGAGGRCDAGAGPTRVDADAGGVFSLHAGRARWGGGMALGWKSPSGGHVHFRRASETAVAEALDEVPTCSWRPTCDG